MRFVERNGKNMFVAGANLEPFHVTSERRGKGAYLRVSGEIDMATAPVLDERLRAAQSNGFTRVVVDFEHVTFMDVSGLHCLLRAAARARLTDKPFAMVKTPAIVERVLQITRSAHLLDPDPLGLATDTVMAGPESPVRLPGLPKVRSRGPRRVI
jgi:anti-sigma B factor antagonist